VTETDTDLLDQRLGYGSLRLFHVRARVEALSQPCNYQMATATRRAVPRPDPVSVECAPQRLLRCSGASTTIMAKGAESKRTDKAKIMHTTPNAGKVYKAAQVMTTNNPADVMIGACRPTATSASDKTKQWG